MITTGDDQTIEIWDYLSKSGIQTLEGHKLDVSLIHRVPAHFTDHIVIGSEGETF